MVRGLLVYSRVGRSPEPPSDIELDELVATVRLDLGQVITERGASLSSEPLPCISGQPELVRLVLQNLLSNALKFVPAGRTPIIEVRAAVEGGLARITVADNGIGIAPEQTEAVFTAFHRLHSKDEYEGTGIGLAIVHKAVTHHGGRVWLEPRPGGGTLAHFTQPLVRPAGARSKAA